MPARHPDIARASFRALHLLVALATALVVAPPPAAADNVDVRTLRYDDELTMVAQPWGSLVIGYWSNSAHDGLFGRGWCGALHVTVDGSEYHRDIETTAVFSGQTLRIERCPGHGDGHWSHDYELDDAGRAALKGRTLEDFAKSPVNGPELNLRGGVETVKVSAAGIRMTDYREPGLTTILDFRGRTVQVNDAVLTWDDAGHLQTIGTPGRTFAVETEPGSRRIRSTEFENTKTGADFRYTDGALSSLRTAWLRVVRFTRDRQDRIVLTDYGDRTYSSVFYDPASGRVRAHATRQGCIDLYRRLLGRTADEQKVLRQVSCKDAKDRALEIFLWSTADHRDVLQSEFIEMSPDGAEVLIGKRTFGGLHD